MVAGRPKQVWAATAGVSPVSAPATSAKTNIARVDRRRIFISSRWFAGASPRRGPSIRPFGSPIATPPRHHAATAPRGSPRGYLVHPAPGPPWCTLGGPLGDPVVTVHTLERRHYTSITRFRVGQDTIADASGV